MRCDIAGRAKQREYIERWRWRMSGFGWRVNWKLMRGGYGIIKRTDRWLNLLDWLPNHMPREEHITLIAHTQIADHIATELNTRIEYNYTRIGTRPDQTRLDRWKRGKEVTQWPKGRRCDDVLLLLFMVLGLWRWRWWRLQCDRTQAHICWKIHRSAI